jgi:hypothetical protein
MPDGACAPLPPAGAAPAGATIQRKAPGGASERPPASVPLAEARRIPTAAPVRGIATGAVICATGRSPSAAMSDRGANFSSSRSSSARSSPSEADVSLICARSSARTLRARVSQGAELPATSDVATSAGPDVMVVAAASRGSGRSGPKTSSAVAQVAMAPRVPSSTWTPRRTPCCQGGRGWRPASAGTDDCRGSLSTQSRSSLRTCMAEAATRHAEPRIPGAWCPRLLRRLRPAAVAPRPDRSRPAAGR